MKKLFGVVAGALMAMPASAGYLNITLSQRADGGVDFFVDWSVHDDDASTIDVVYEGFIALSDSYWQMLGFDPVRAPSSTPLFSLAAGDEWAPGVYSAPYWLTTFHIADAPADCSPHNGCPLTGVGTEFEQGGYRYYTTTLSGEVTFTLSGSTLAALPARVTEPGTLALLALGAMGLLAARKAARR